MMFVARIFEDVGGYYVCNDAAKSLIKRTDPYSTKAAALREAASRGFTHAVGSGTYWDSIRRIPVRFRNE